MIHSKCLIQNSCFNRKHVDTVKIKWLDVCTSCSFICFIVDDIKILVLQNIIACSASVTTFLMDKHLNFFNILSLVIFNILSLSHITKVKWIVLVTSVSCWLYFEKERGAKILLIGEWKQKCPFSFCLRLCGCVNNSMMTNTWLLYHVERWYIFR